MTRVKSSYGIKHKEQIKKKIAKLDYNEQCEIFNIIRKDTDKISENNNGVFINLKYIKDETLDKMSSFIEYCEKNKQLIIEEEKKKEYDNTKNITNIEVNSTSKSNISQTSSKSIEDNSLEENLSEGYELYTMGNEYIADIKKKTEIIDKFSFKTYIDKLSVTSQKNFQSNETNEKKIPLIKTKKLKLNGVKARLMRRCRNINKNSNFHLKAECDKKTKIESIINDNISELDKLSNISDLDNEIEIDDNDMEDESFNDKSSYISNELTEEYDFIK